MAVLHPFNETGVVRGTDGIARYEKRLPSLVHMLRASADSSPDHEALVEVGGGRLTYQEFWDRSARIA
jgi:acyl-CoA synthetase (AMP-forming)/AMP-acid ligase II